METFFLFCSILGGTVLVCQFLLALIGIGSGSDVDHAHDGGGGDHDAGHGGHDHHEAANDAAAAWYVGVLTFKSITAGVTFLGLGGLAAAGNEVHPFLSLMVGLATGLAAMFMVALLMRALHRLKAEGTVRADRALGAQGTVYLTVPAERRGTGKVTLTFQNRTVEWQAITAHHELPTGSKVVVVAIVGPGTVEVAAA